MTKSDNVNRKFTETIDINDYEIETDTGFVDIVSLNKTIPYLKYIIKTKSGKELNCADNHILFDKNFNEIFAKELNVGDIIKTCDGDDVVISIENTGEYENMYDFELCKTSNHRYFTNGVLSHNTLIAKKLAKEIFGTETALVRFDMSEYPDKTAVNKLIGSNPGYVGYEEGGQLTETVKNNKYCVLLLDEIEKADPEVYNIFLQVLDEGFLTDNSGQKVDFSNVIVIFTSNVGAKAASDFGKGLGFNEDVEKNTKNILNKQLKNRFPPEFLNRLDNVVYFNSLTDDNLKEIIRIELNKLTKNLNEMNYQLSYDENSLNYILGIVSKDKDFGARPIMRAIQENIEDKITDIILERDLPENYMFKVSCSNNNEIVVE